MKDSFQTSLFSTNQPIQNKNKQNFNDQKKIVSAMNRQTSLNSTKKSVFFENNAKIQMNDTISPNHLKEKEQIDGIIQSHVVEKQHLADRESSKWADKTNFYIPKAMIPPFDSIPSTVQIPHRWSTHSSSTSHDAWNGITNVNSKTIYTMMFQQKSIQNVPANSSKVIQRYRSQSLRESKEPFLMDFNNQKRREESGRKEEVDEVRVDDFTE